MLSWGIASGLALLVSLLAIIAWLQSFGSSFEHVSLYQVFPLFGLIAFSLMWTHYITGFIKKAGWLHTEIRPYYQVTGYIVLVAILLHPSLLAYQLFKDGMGLPPGSEYRYVAPGLGWLTIVGMLSLLIFLAFELHRWFKDKPWWKYVSSASDVAMLAIFYHGLKLGHLTNHGWYYPVWLFYGVTLVACLAYKYTVAWRVRWPSPTV